MKKLAVITATRAEYGLLSPVIRELRTYEGESFRAELIVTGTHLSEAYGMTVREIVDDGLRIDHRIAVSVASGSPEDISRNQAEILTAFTALFCAQRYDAILILGDRYETLMFATAAMNTHIPVFHIFGGDISEGAIDDAIRHAVTKMSCLHFPTSEESRKRVIQLGEDPARVFNFGSPGVDNILRAAKMDRAEALQMCTYHPVTLGDGDVDGQMEAFFQVIRRFSALEFIVTKSNADEGGKRINDLLDAAAREMGNLHVYDSLGMKRYLSLMKHSEFVLGNSSSGIMEAPSFHIPTVNIGDRQKGRQRVASIIDCAPDADSIAAAIETAMSPDMRGICAAVVSPYGDGHAAERIAGKCVETLRGPIDLKKQFYYVAGNRLGYRLAAFCDGEEKPCRPDIKIL